MTDSVGGTTRPDRLRVEARCTWCGLIPLGPDDLGIFAGGEPEGLLEFLCPSCERLNLRRLSAFDLDLLAEVGIDPEHRPAPFELLERRAGPPITLDDLIDLHQDLARLDLAGADLLAGSFNEPITNERHAS